MNRIEQLLAFLQETPNDSFLNYALATEYVGLGDDDKAETIFRQLLENNADYVATYYHLGKLLERKQQKTEAMDIYRFGIEKAKSVGEQHSLSELQSALLELEYE
jgi:tetratricopeptide (TPR) repeat protein